MITKEPGDVNVGILYRYVTPEGRCHNPHGPSVIYINDEGYEYNLNGKNHNIVGIMVYVIWRNNEGV